MPNQHQIRETAVQLLYSLQMEGLASPETRNFDPFWEVLQEQDCHKLLTARANAIEHMTQDRQEMLAAFEERLEKALPLLADKQDAVTFLDSLIAIRTEEHVWNSALHTLFAYFKSPVESRIDELARLLENLFTSNAILLNRRKLLLEAAEQSPALAPVLDPVLGSIRKLQAIGNRVAAIAKPHNFPENNEVRHLRTAEDKINNLRQKTSSLVVNILTHLATVDKVLSETVENYSPERLAAVDKAVLRLGTYEILYLPDLSLSVIISEAVETALKFSGTDSSRFTHGVLDSVGKIHRPT